MAKKLQHDSVWAKYDIDNDGTVSDGELERATQMLELDLREEKQDSLLPVNEYEELFPHKNVSKSLEKYLEYDKNPTHTKAMGWLDREMNTKPKKFKKSSNGDFIAYCSKCGGKQFPDKFQVKQLSTCCRVEYLPTNPYNNSVNQLQSKEMINEN